MKLLLIYIFLDVRTPALTDNLYIGVEGFGFFFPFFSYFFWKKLNSLFKGNDTLEFSEQGMWEIPSGRNLKEELRLGQR